MIIYGVGGLIIALFLIAPLRNRTFRKLEKLRPGSVAFTIANRREFVDPLSLAAVGTPLGEGAATLTAAPCVTADATGLTVWDNNPLALVGSIPWTDVTQLDAGELRTRYRIVGAASAILLDVAVGGASIRVPLISPNGTNRMFATRREARWLADALNALRPGS
jgi:hypothetical protein